MCTREFQRDVVSEHKGTGMFLPLVGRDPSKARDSRPKPPKKQSFNRATRSRTTSVYMPYQSATSLTQGQMSYQLVPAGLGQGPFGAVANQPAGHLSPPVLGGPRPSSSSSSSHSSSATSCNAAPAGYLSWAVNAPTLSTQQQTVLQQRNTALNMHAHDGQVCALQGVHASVQAGTWMVPVSSSSTYLPPAPALMQPLAAARPAYYPIFIPQVSGVDCSSAGSFNIWGPASDQHTVSLMPAQCMPAACGGYSSLVVSHPQPEQAAAQLMPAAHRHACSAQLLQQPTSSGHMPPMPAAASQQQQAPQILQSSGIIGSTGMPQHGMPAVGLQDRGLILAPVYTDNTVEWLRAPSTQPQHTFLQGQQQQQVQLAVQTTGGAALSVPLQHMVLCG